MLTNIKKLANIAIKSVGGSKPPTSTELAVARIRIIFGGIFFIVGGKGLLSGMLKYLY